jgi:small subunit ribosomal protein S1
MEEAKTTQATPETDFTAVIEANSDIVMPEKGDKIKGQIISINDTAVLVDCGSKSEAELDPKELDGQQVGDEIEAIVMESEPSLKISIKLTGSKEITENLQNAFQNGIPVSGKITREIKGGFEIDVAGKRAFLPMRHLDVRFIQDTSPHLDQTYDFKIIEFNPENDKFVVSRAELLKSHQAEAAEKTWENIAVGATLSGQVSSIQKFGAFVDLGGVDGLVHISELSQGYTNHPSEILKLGQEVRVKVIKADREKNRISLSMKELAPDPWDDLSEKYESGKPFSGVVVRKADFGLFVELEPGIDGLLHVSQLKPDTELGDAPYDIGQTVDGWIRSIDSENKRVSLTLRESSVKNIWDQLPEQYAINNVVEGKVEETTKYGVFVELEPGLTGLMPLSELKKLGFMNPQQDFPTDMALKAKITAIDSDRKRISLLPEDVIPTEAPEKDAPSEKPKRSRRKTNKQRKGSVDGTNGSVTQFGEILAAALKDKND